ncbi:MAG: alpha/beta hydrolase [Acidobacteria bacterium]|nr:alpha/beta hydrolase [Acidobacteriota bacterium]
MTHLVLLPGLDGTGQLFERFRALLPETVDSTVVSYPESSTGYDVCLESTLSKIRHLDRFVVIAESFSGPVAVKLAQLEPERVSGLVLCCSFLNCPIREPLHPLIKLIGRVVFQLPIPVIAIHHWMIGWEADWKLAREICQVLESVPSEVIFKRVNAVLEVEVREIFQTLAQPILIINADQDQLVPRLETSSFSNSSLITVKNIPGPHLILQTYPTQTWDVINSFLNQHHLIEC